MFVLKLGKLWDIEGLWISEKIVVESMIKQIYKIRKWYKDENYKTDRSMERGPHSCRSVGRQKNKYDWKLNGYKWQVSDINVENGRNSARNESKYRRQWGDYEKIMRRLDEIANKLDENAKKVFDTLLSPIINK